VLLFELVAAHLANVFHWTHVAELHQDLNVESESYEHDTIWHVSKKSKKTISCGFLFDTRQSLLEKGDTGWNIT
jgi:hypothetical protein